GASITAGESNSGITLLFDIAASNQSICTGSCIDFTDLTTPQPNSWSWQFDGANTSTSAVENPTNICYDVAGTYDVILTITNSCGTFDFTFDDFIEVLDVAQPVIIADGPLTFCEGQSVELSVNTPGTYQWQFNGNDIIDAIQNVYEATETGDYQVVVTNGPCAAVSETITISSGLTPYAAILPDDDQFLCDDSMLIVGESDGDIQWYLDGNPIIGATSDQLLVSSSGTYWFEASFGGSCATLSDPIQIALGIEATINITASDDSVCAGDIITLTISGDYDSFTWENGSDSLTRSITSTGVYSVIAEKEGCLADSSVVLFFSPLPTIDAGLDLESTCEGYMEMFATGEGEISWWLDETLLIDSSVVVVEAPSNNITYTAKATLDGCISEDQMMITSDCVSIYIPNSLTPNEDGINDVFKVEARGVSIYEFIIFNRWGDEVFRSTDPDDVWTGGKDDYYVPDGVYVYQITALNEKNESLIDKKHMRGTITVFR
ncbi:MAG: gliding motility-associated C-terminal domain-containing protein, partial [Flavobacteriales bacterium]|nr:gliding motility-associated C-terminal domain-containing protein [Flavobacteriales bacterium]